MPQMLTENLQVRITSRLKSALDAKAAAMGLRPSDVVRVTLAEALSSELAQQPSETMLETIEKHVQSHLAEHPGLTQAEALDAVMEAKPSLYRAYENERIAAALKRR